MNLAQMLRRYTIRSRMIGAIVIVLSLVVVVGSVGMLGLQRSGRLVEHFIASIHHDAVEVGTLRGELGEIRRYEKDLMLNVADAEAVKSDRAKWAKSVESARARARALAGGTEDDGTKIAGRIGEQLGAYQTRAEAVWAQIGEGKFADPTEVNKAFADAKKSIHDTESDINAFAEHVKAEAKSDDEDRLAIQRQSLAWFGGAIALAVLVIVPSALANMVSICEPVERAREHAMRIANGNLTVEITDDGHDENARLLGELATMQQALRRLVGDLRKASENIGTASAEIASGNADLSHRTEQTASSLQQAAGSLQQITGSVRQTADSAAQANQLAASASSVATRGGEAVAHVVSTMGEIETSSRKISDIIGTIDGIAFQTNILALNAAVEAARAGEQGRGFAVVAGEVRTLAQRSAEAAREIKTLIGASVERVETGTRLVSEAGTTMSEIVDSVRRVTDVIGEITASTTEQSQSIGQVNAAVTQLDQMTQQNAALVEQSAAAAESLKDQAGRLVSVVGAFQVAETVASSSGRAVAAAAGTPGIAKHSAAPRAAPPSTPKRSKAGGPAVVAETVPRHRAAPEEPTPGARSSVEPALQAQQVIARARHGTPPAGPGDAGESDWESF